MPKLTTIYRLPYLTPGEPLTGTVDRVRFLAIDRQLEAIFTFLGNGIISGWEIVKNSQNSKKIDVSPGSGVVSSIAAASSSFVTLLDPTLPTDGSLLRNNVYVKLLGSTPYTASAEFVITTQSYSTDVYLPLGYIMVDSNGVINSINMGVDSGRKELDLIKYIATLVSKHVHTGAPGEPDKIDLFEHVKGVLSAANIEDLPANKITSGIISKDRFSLSHKDLKDVGTLTHEDLDSLVEKLQNLNQMLFGDLMTANLMQIILSMKHIYSNVDDYLQNFAAIIPGIENSTLLNEKTFIDINATGAELDFENHVIRGKFVDSKELGQYSINTLSEFTAGTYNPIFVTITENGENVQTTSAYGYGYGYGAGLDYFDVIETNFYDNTFDTMQVVFDFEGTAVGYGYSTLDQTQNFETANSQAYAYGYGFEYGSSYFSTQGTTFVYLNAKGADLLIFDKDLGNVIKSISSSTYEYPLNSDPDTEGSESFIDKKVLISTASNWAKFDDGVESGKPKRGDLVASISTPGTTSFYTYTDFRKVKNNVEISTFITSDKSLLFGLWTDSYDATSNNTLNIILKQSGGTFTEDWTYDYSMDLIIEATDDTTTTNRYYYRYAPGADTSYRFFTKGDTPFINGEIDDDGVTPIATMAAELKTENLEFIYGFIDPETKIVAPTDAIDVSLSDPGWDAIKANVTGLVLLTQREDGYYIDNHQAIPIRWPQGDGFGLVGGVDSGMLVDIDRAYFSGSLEYGTSLDNNKVEALSVDFPDTISVESISWESSEPGDSVIYLQIKRNPSLIDGLDAGEPDYRDNLFFTKNDVAFTSGTYKTAFDDAFGADPFNTIRTYVDSGVALPLVFAELYSACYGLSVRAVLLPTTDKKVTPVLNSITINYSTETTSGTLEINTQDDFENALSVDNINIEDGTVSVLETGRTGNVVYGSYKKLVEIKSNFKEKYTSNYSGTNLPRTSLQILNEDNAGLEGFVTDLKILPSGNIIFLDRDTSRIIEVDKNRNLVNMWMSEYSFDKNYTTSPSIPASAEAKATYCVYNRQLGDNGVLYVIFSHQLDAWASGVKLEENIRPEWFNIRFKGLNMNLSAATAYAVDKGILAFELTSDISNWIETIEAPILELKLIKNDVDGSSCVKFLNSEVSIATFDSSLQKLRIKKIGNKAQHQGSYNVIYAPIQGTVAFDIDDDGYLYIVKDSKPYPWDTNNERQMWYVKIDSKKMFKTQLDSFVEANYNFKQGSFSIADEWSPSFETSSYFGKKGSVQYKEGHLLFCLSGEKNNGVYVFKKDTTTTNTQYPYPTQITLDNDGTYPMDARFDPKTFNSTANEYGDIYIALSDLRRSAGSSSNSKFLKIKPDGTKDWTWGKRSEDLTVKYSVGANSIRPLENSTEDTVIMSS